VSIEVLGLGQNGTGLCGQRVYTLNPPALAKGTSGVELIGVAKRATTSKVEALEPKAGW